MTEQDFGSFKVTMAEDKIALIMFNRPPANTFSLSVYEDLGRMVDVLADDDSFRVAVLAAPEDSRAWCGGADVTDFKDMTAEKRRERYEFINCQMPKFAGFDRPLVAAINGTTVGVGIILASLCDLRVAAEDARFACPEVNYGLVVGGAGLYSEMGFPEAKLREMAYTGRKFTARELEPTGFFNYVVPAEQVMDKAMGLARGVAEKSLPVLRASKQNYNNKANVSWVDAYYEAQELSAGLVGARDSREGVDAFLQKRKAKLQDS